VSHDVKVITAIACDDVRQEVTGKQILIGVYGPEIWVSHFPAHFVLHVVPIGTFQASPELRMRLRLSGNLRAPVSIESKFQGLKDTKMAPLPPFRAPIVVDGPGVIQLESQEGEAWKVVQEWSVASGTPAAHNEQQPRTS